jgi:hypothetical protein
MGGGGAAAGNGGAELPEQWSCLGEVTWDEPQVDPIPVRLAFPDMYTGQAADGLLVRACPSVHDDCAVPDAEGITGEDPRDPGYVHFELPAGRNGWAGYFEVSGGDPVVNLIPVVRPFTNGVDIEYDVVTAGVLDVLLDVVTGTSRHLRHHGHAGVRVFDCYDQPAPGVVVDLGATDAFTVRTYLESLFPAPELSETVEDGLAAFANVPHGVVTVTARLAGTGDIVGVTDVPIRDGAVTTFGLPPTPRR